MRVTRVYLFKRDTEKEREGERDADRQTDRQIDREKRRRRRRRTRPWPLFKFFACATDWRVCFAGSRTFRQLCCFPNALLLLSSYVFD